MEVTELVMNAYQAATARWDLWTDGTQTGCSPAVVYGIWGTLIMTMLTAVGLMVKGLYSMGRNVGLGVEQLAAASKLAGLAFVVAVVGDVLITEYTIRRLSVFYGTFDQWFGRDVHRALSKHAMIIVATFVLVVVRIVHIWVSLTTAGTGTLPRPDRGQALPSDSD